MADKLKLKREERAELLTRIEHLKEIGKNRNWSPEEKKEAYAAKTELEILVKDIEELEAQEKISMQKAFNTMSAEADWENKEGRFDFSILKKIPDDLKAPISQFVKRNYDIDADAEKADVFKVLAALAGGPTDKHTNAALRTIKTVSGGNTQLTELLSAQLWEAGVSRSHLARVGMGTFLMDEPTVRFPKIGTYPVAEWKAQGATQTEKSATLTSVDGTAATLRTWLSAPAELLQDSKTGNALRRAFSVSIANEVDRAGLYGSGVGEEPLGVANYPGIPTFDLDGRIENYDPFVEMQKEIYDADGPACNATIGSPDMWLQIQKLKGSNEYNPMQPPSALADHLFLQTTKAPTDEGASGNNSSAVMGGFSSLHLGIRLNTNITITPLTADTYSYSLIGAFRGQFFVERIADMGVITNIQPDSVT